MGGRSKGRDSETGCILVLQDLIYGCSHVCGPHRERRASGLQECLLFPTLSRSLCGIRTLWPLFNVDLKLSVLGWRLHACCFVLLGQVFSLSRPCGPSWLAVQFAWLVSWSSRTLYSFLWCCQTTRPINLVSLSRSFTVLRLTVLLCT